MQRILLYGTIAAAACTAVLLASEVWKTKEYTQWTYEEANKILTDSPWAKQKAVPIPQSSSEPRRSSSGGSGRGGGGYPGGGGGYPGSGGIGLPGGGMGGGSRRGGGGGGTRGDDRRPSTETVNVVVRWDSALPIQHALLRQTGRTADDPKPDATAIPPDTYVIAVMGLTLPHSDAYGDDQDLSDDAKDRAKAQDRMREQLLDAGQLIVRGRTVAADDVRLEGRNGSIAMRFIFPKSAGISAEEKDVTFTFASRGVKLEHKFHLPDMVYLGKLAI